MIVIKAAEASDADSIATLAGQSLGCRWNADYVRDRLSREDTHIFVAGMSDDCMSTGGISIDGLSTAGVSASGISASGVSASGVSASGVSASGQADIIGFAAIREVDDSLELLQIVVDSGFRRRAAGSLLLGAIFDYAKEKALTSVFLEVRADNHAAISLYEKFGFSQVRVRKDYYDNPAEDAIVMVCDVICF